jgi:hypothetical protein
MNVSYPAFLDDPAELRWGQRVVVGARWILVASGLLLATIAPASVTQLRIQSVLVLALAVCNFGLLAQLIRNPRPDPLIAYAASAADVVVVTVLVIAQGGFGSDLFVFYFPAILALSLCFAMPATVLFVGVTVLAYGVVSAPTASTAADLQTLLLRCGALIAVAVCAQVYRSVEATRRKLAETDVVLVPGAPTDARKRDAITDIYFGQIVLVWARWFVIGAAAISVLWSTTDESAVQLGGRILVLVVLLGINFYVHGRQLTSKPANRRILLVASLADFTAISFMVIAWPGAGLGSPFYVLYIPVLLGLGLVFNPRIAVPVTVLAGAFYTTAVFFNDVSPVAHIEPGKDLIMRVVVLLAAGGLGTYFWRIQRDRRMQSRHSEPQKRPDVVEQPVPLASERA